MDTLSKNVSAIVEYDYQAKQPDELSLVKGAIINNIKIQPGGWWEGTVTATGKCGMFPDNFVRVLEPHDQHPVVLRDKSAVQNRRCKVIYSYKENNNDELTLAVGDVIEVIGEVEEGWWRGKLGARVGVFPSNFVEAIDLSALPISANRISATTQIIQTNNIQNKNNKSHLSSSREDLVSSNTDLSLHDAPSLPPKPVRELCRVKFAYKPANEDELKLIEGDIITIHSKELPDKGWWKGEHKGKIGVFPDNFVELLPPENSSPIKDTQPKPDRPPPSSKMLVNKSPNTTNSFRKDSFGSRDSLNDNFSGLSTSVQSAFTNVAAQRKSLEHRNLDLTLTPADKPPKKGGLDIKSDLRKSIENLDEKKSSQPPPVLGKKPSVPIKKSPSITSVTGNLFSGLKNKVKGSGGGDSKLSSSDSLDGGASSRLSIGVSSGGIADNSEKGITGERIRKDDSIEFDSVERSHILQDMRANRAKAPKRRPPTSAVSILGEPNNNVLNGAGGIFIDNNNYPPDSPKSTGSGGGGLADQEGGDHEMSARPRTREWEKHKVPWMDELKMSQAKKTPTGVGELSKSPPEAQSRSTAAVVPDTTSDEKYDMSKSFSNSSFHKKSLDHGGGAQTTTTDIRPITFDHHKINSSTSFDSGGNTNNSAMMMTKSMSSLSTKISISASSTTAVGGGNNTTTTIQENSNENSNNTTNHTPQTATGRPTSVTLRNRSISPLSRSSQQKPPHVSSTSSVNQHPGVAPEIIRVSTTTNDHNNVTAARGYYDLEQRVNKLERIVKTQNLLIDELVKLLGDDSERIRILRSELDKHTQAVIQDQKLVYL